MPEYNGNERRKENSEVFVLIEEIRGSLKVIVSKIENLVISVDSLKSTTVTREELKLTIDPIKEEIESLKSFRDRVLAVIGIIAFGVLAYTISHAIPGFKI